MNKNILLRIGAITFAVMMVTVSSSVGIAYSDDNSICKNGDCVNKNIIKNECSGKDSTCANAAAIEVGNSISVP